MSLPVSLAARSRTDRKGPVTDLTSRSRADRPAAPAEVRRARPVAAAGSRRGPGLGVLLLDEGFWGHRQATNGDATLQDCYDWMERLGWLANFARVADGTTGGHRPGWQFSDSEVYKLLEALAWETGRSPNPR